MLISEREVFNGSSDLQMQYDDFANAELQRLHLCRCPYGCGLNCLRIHGYYARFVEALGCVSRVRVMRLVCSLCGRTHALFGAGIVPYSRFLSTECHEACRDPFPFQSPILDFLARRRRALSALYSLLGIVIGETPPAQATRALLPRYRLAFLQTSRRAPCHPYTDTT
jgi:hypothetical protein